MPTTAESGYPVGRIQSGCLAWACSRPRARRANVVNTLNAAINDSLKSPEMKAALAKLGFEPMPATPQEFATFLAAETKKWPPLLAAAGMKGE